MKLKQLLESFEFDDLFPSIVEMYPNAKRHKRQFAEAFDIATATYVSFSKKSIRYQLMEDPNSKDTFFGAGDSCFAGTWDIVLGKNVNRDKGVDLTDEEVAANCLLNLIFISTPPPAFQESRNRLFRS